MFNRDSIVWTLGFFAAVLAFVVSQTDLIPHAQADKVRDISAVLGAICALLKASPMPRTGSPDQDVDYRGLLNLNEPPKP